MNRQNAINAIALALVAGYVIARLAYRGPGYGTPLDALIPLIGILGGWVAVQLTQEST